MGKLAATLCLAIAVLLGSNAHAESYLSVNIGPAMLSDSDTTSTANNGTGRVTGDSSFDNGFDINGALGTSLGAIRLEGEIAYRKNDWDTFAATTGTLDITGSFTSLSFMANGWYDFDIDPDWVPFLGGGVGMSLMNMEITSSNGTPSSYDESDTVFAYQVGAGLGYKVSPKITISLSYRVFGTSEVEFVDPTDTDTYDYRNHSVLLGVRHNF